MASGHPRGGRPRDPELDGVILASALRLLSAQGYARMSVDAVAAAAGVSKPTIYRRFRTKADLATAALASVIDDGARLPDGLTVEVALGRTLEQLARRLRARSSMALVGTLLVEEEQTPELIALFRERVWARRAGALREVLLRAVASGEVDRRVDVDAVVCMLIGSLYAVHLSQAKIPRRWAARVVKVALDGLR
jgi:AcrR family transcriptional regulator